MGALTSCCGGGSSSYEDITPADRVSYLFHFKVINVIAKSLIDIICKIEFILF